MLKGERSQREGLFLNFTAKIACRTGSVGVRDVMCAPGKGLILRPRRTDPGV